MPIMKTLTVNDVCFDVYDGAAIHYVLYDSLSKAIEDINNDVTTNSITDLSTAKVRVTTADNGAKIVMLLADVDESAQININANINLVLNGHVINLTTSGACLYFGADTDCTINGEVTGSVISKACDSASSVYLINTPNPGCKRLAITGGSYTVSGSNTTVVAFRIYASRFELHDAIVTIASTASGTNARAFQISGNTFIKNSAITVNGSINPYGLYISGGDTEIEGSSVTVTTAATTKTAYGIRTTTAAGAISVNNTTISVVADESAYGISHAGTGASRVAHCTLSVSTTLSAGSAHGVYTASTATAYITDSTIFTVAPSSAYSVGIANLNGLMIVNNSDSIGTRSGIQNSTGGQLYVTGGVFTGYTTGGIYLTHGSTGSASIKDATMCSGNYNGEFSDILTTIFGSSASTNNPALEIGGSSGTEVFLDSCHINEDAAGTYGIVMRGADSITDLTVNISNSSVINPISIEHDEAKLRVGFGTNITIENVNRPACVEFTEGLYRKYAPNESLQGKDMSVMTDFILQSITNELALIVEGDG